MQELQNALQRVKNQNWASATVSFYVVRRRLVRREANYDLLSVNVDEKLRRKLRNITVDCVNKANQAWEYDFNTSDLDGDVLGMEISETDMQFLIESLTSQEPLTQASDYEELLGAWIYITRLDLNEVSPLYAVRKVSSSWKATKVSQLVSMVFANNMLVDIEEKDIFRIDGKVDFFAHGGTLFIADKKNFESALNFREGMLRNRDTIVEEFEAASLFADAAQITELIGDNMRRLRKLSQVKKAGYYSDEAFLDNLKRVSAEEGWEIVYDDEGRIVVTEDDIDTVLTVLNNDRLKSPINQEGFDVDVKHKIGE